MKPETLGEENIPVGSNPEEKDKDIQIEALHQRITNLETALDGMLTIFTEISNYPEMINSAAGSTTHDWHTAEGAKNMKDQMQAKIQNIQDTLRH